jgi:hypothetical protein
MEQGETATWQQRYAAHRSVGAYAKANGNVQLTNSLYKNQRYSFQQ